MTRRYWLVNRHPERYHADYGIPLPEGFMLTDAELAEFRAEERNRRTVERLAQKLGVTIR
jgi:hypothetical protein